MILYADRLLCAWGAWSRRQAARAVGYPSVSPMFKDAPAGECYDSKPPLGVDESDNAATDAAIQRLCPDERRLCVEVYQIGGKTVEIAARLGWHRQRVPERLDRMQQRLLGHLNDIAAGG
ncbi:hypothetical protein GPA19_08080 [Azoarcus indigens]|uniref:Uncharacterized protein n=1 Tax=Azoarcus indigens TaxID=29545 RepID=A0A4R6DYK8_9RHOO|nr:hypothetical protein [Azoarcus indigens]NMG64902.1 hypothetical protein [Azoarcus indigens]TDN50440.1 hypothetical protein C7389_109134 [Azoarcus indigens]